MNVPRESGSMTVSSSIARLDPGAAHTLLARYAIRMPAQAVARTSSEAVAAAARIGFPVALKIVAAEVSHKTDVGGVRLGLARPHAVSDAFDAILAAVEHAHPGVPIDGVLVQQMVDGGVEMFVGARRDPLWGPVVLCGVGGIFVELLHDVVMQPAPVTLATAAAMLTRLQASAILDGIRGTRVADRAALVNLLVAVGRLIVDRADVVELDLNPVVVRGGGGGAIAVDARIVVYAEPRPPEPPTPHAVSASTALSRMLNPASVAIVGASADGRKLGGRLLRYVAKHGYAGQVYLVNHGGGEINGVPVYRSLRALPEVVDLACVAVPEHAVAGVIEECGAVGTRAAVVYTSGFGETGEEGLRREWELAAVAQQHGVRMCGPNTVGLVSAPSRCYAAFGMALELDSVSGDIALLTQSGALGGSILSRCWAAGIGISHWICSGNEADLTVADYLSHLVDDPETRVIALFLESVRDPEGFRRACRRAAEARKPIVVFKTGRSGAGARAVASHSGALAGDAVVYDAVFRSLGVVQVHDLQSLMDVAQALSWQAVPGGRRIAVVSTSGGACSIVADECEAVGLQMPALTDMTRRRVASLIPNFGVSDNPMDLTAQIMVDPSAVAKVLDAVLDEPGIDALLMMLTTNADPPAIDVARSVVAAVKKSGKPTLVVRTGAEALAPRSLEVYREGRVPVFPMPDRAVRALGAMVDWAEAVGAEA